MCVSLIPDVVMELQLTPARRVWEKDGKSKQHHGRWQLHRQRDPPLDIALRKRACVPDPVRNEIPSRREQALERDEIRPFLGGRQLGDVEGHNGQQGARGQSSDGAARDHHANVDGAGLDGRANNGEDRRQVDEALAAPSVHEEAGAEAADAVAGVVARDDGAGELRGHVEGVVHVQLEGIVGDGGGYDACVNTVHQPRSRISRISLDCVHGEVERTRQGR